MAANGERPTFADDEKLIAALHEALVWAAAPEVIAVEDRDDGDDRWLIEPC
ncbi:hypothetical protein [Amycolatopsis sp. NPDC098790]|uniref:hypothetical protein n=1 Tax=Amycolatopsis sp. NPDC098790 TaxID=3363939 RepID=UPI0037F62AF9